jgi:DNA-binding NtrC family response regulator
MATILMVDDEPLICQLMGISLGRLGHEVLFASSGREGLNAVRTARPSLVILDLVLPDMDGLDALKKIRRMEPGTVVVIFTAWGSERATRKALSTGAAAFIQKGDTPGLLRSTVARMLESQTVASPESEQQAD